MRLVENKIEKDYLIFRAGLTWLTGITLAIVLTPLWFGVGRAANATIAAAAPVITGGKIVFNSNRDGNNEIYAMNADGSNQTRLTNNTADDISAAWSPDGSRIAFSSNRAGNNDIWVMNADGSNPVQLTTDPNYDGAPDWSPDGLRITFTSNRVAVASQYADVFVMNADGSGQTQLTDWVLFDGDSVFSPDGTKIAFSRQDDPWDIWIMDSIGGSGKTNFTNSPTFSGQHNTVSAWSPDGTRIAFSHLYDGSNYEIVYQNVSGGGIIRLTNDLAFDFMVGWSPDSTQLTFMSDRTGNQEIYVMNADGLGVINITNNPAQDNDPDWAAGSVGSTPTPTPIPTPTPTPNPTTTPTPTPQIGPPTNKEQCKNGGWQAFNTPRTFKNQGDCVQYVDTGH